MRSYYSNRYAADFSAIRRFKRSRLHAELADAMLPAVQQQPAIVPAAPQQPIAPVLPALPAGQEAQQPDPEFDGDQVDDDDLLLLDEQLQGDAEAMGQGDLRHSDSSSAESAGWESEWDSDAEAHRVLEEADEEEAAGVRAAEALPALGTAEYHRAQLDNKAWEGSAFSTRQLMSGLHTVCREWGKMTDRAFDDLLLLLNLAHGGRRSTSIPSSLYLFKKVMGVPELQSLEYHACTCDQHCWDPLDHKKWRAPAEGDDDPLYKCPKCGAPRFTTPLNKLGHGTLRPARVREGHATCEML